jgi:hypothetical protein
MIAGSPLIGVKTVLASQVAAGADPVTRTWASAGWLDDSRL